jgi:hypothetical protein
LVDPFAFLVGLLLIEPDEVTVYDNASEPINFILLQELAVFADGAELHIVHPEQAADFEMLIDVIRDSPDESRTDVKVRDFLDCGQAQN